MAGEAGIPAHRYGHIADPGYELGFSYTGKVKLKLCYINFIGYRTDVLLQKYRYYV